MWLNSITSIDHYQMTFYQIPIRCCHRAPPSSNMLLFFLFGKIFSEMVESALRQYWAQREQQGGLKKWVTFMLGCRFHPQSVITVTWCGDGIYKRTEFFGNDSQAYYYNQNHVPAECSTFEYNAMLPRQLTCRSTIIRFLTSPFYASWISNINCATKYFLNPN